MADDLPAFLLLQGAQGPAVRKLRQALADQLGDDAQDYGAAGELVVVRIEEDLEVDPRSRHRQRGKEKAQCEAEPAHGH